MFAENAKARGIDLADVDALVISHGHFDHTGGVEAFAAQNAHAPIYLHEEALYVTYGQTHGVMDDYNCGILWDDDLREKTAAPSAPDKRAAANQQPRVDRRQYSVYGRISSGQRTFSANSSQIRSSNLTL